MAFTRLASGQGFCYIDASKIIAAGAPFQTKGHDESRQLALNGTGFTPYIHNTAENYAALVKAGVKIGDAREWRAHGPRARTKGRAGRDPAEKVNGTAKRAEPTAADIKGAVAAVAARNETIMRLHDELHKLRAVVDGAFMAEAVTNNPAITAAEVLKQWRAHGRLVPRRAPAGVA